MPWSFKDWYEEHSVTLNASRRNRYHTDKKYREQVLARNKESSKKARQQRRQEAVDGGQRVRMSRALKEVVVTVEIDGKPQQIRAYTLGVLAAMLGKSKRTLYKWERDGLLPDTPFRSKGGHRLYTMEMMEWIKTNMEEIGKVNSNVKVRRKGDQRGVVKVVEWPDGHREKTRLFRLGMLARVLGKTRETLLYWEREELIPDTPLRTDRMSHRMYTVRMIEVVKEAFDAEGGYLRGEESKARFQRTVASGWAEVMRARIVDPMAEVRSEVH